MRKTWKTFYGRCCPCTSTTSAPNAGRRGTQPARARTCCSRRNGPRSRSRWCGRPSRRRGSRNNSARMRTTTGVGPIAASSWRSFTTWRGRCTNRGEWKRPGRSGRTIGSCAASSVRPPPRRSLHGTGRDLFLCAWRRLDLLLIRIPIRRRVELGACNPHGAGFQYPHARTASRPSIVPTRGRPQPSFPRCEVPCVVPCFPAHAWRSAPRPAWPRRRWPRRPPPHPTSTSTCPTTPRWSPSSTSGRSLTGCPSRSSSGTRSSSGSKLG